MNKNESSFSYTYFANQQAEVENIRKKYLPQEESSFEKLKRLDKKAGRKGSIVYFSWYNKLPAFGHRNVFYDALDRLVRTGDRNRSDRYSRRGAHVSSLCAYNQT